MVFVPSPYHQPSPYHHGSLRTAMVDAGVQLAREGGPAAIVLREVARRIGVSPNAAYRHFAALPELTDAVADAALAALAASMQRERAGLPDTDDPLLALSAVGRGYVHFALAEPGLFAAAFSRAKDQIDPEYETPDGQRTASGLLHDALDGLAAAGLLAPEDREAAVTMAWAAVHGLSMLLLGPLAAVPASAREPMIDATLTLVCRGLTTR
ncbi:MAG TPA: TetR/AcrR family transcriptional regulator [Frankiaceae bacterium]|jgi:AcrR family transcriptional regulator|nr:TetR/AcrR family transcriptional regulator [Frankiaceae bacterium]